MNPLQTLVSLASVYNDASSVELVGDVLTMAIVSDHSKALLELTMCSGHQIGSKLTVTHLSFDVDGRHTLSPTVSDTLYYDIQPLLTIHEQMVGHVLLSKPTLANDVIDLATKTRRTLLTMFDGLNLAKCPATREQNTTTNLGLPTRVTPEAIDKLIAASTIEYATFDNTMTVAVVRLPHGFKEVGQSACSDPADANEVIGRERALAHARAKIWEHESYSLAKDTYREVVRSYQGGM